MVMRSTVARAPARQPGAAPSTKAAGATRTAVATFGVLAALAGIEHGVGELLQGSVRPSGLVIRSWPDTAAMAILDGEPAMTLIPNLLVTGVLAVAVAAAAGIWSVRSAQRRHGGLVLLGLAALLLLVGGGFGPPLVLAICAVAAMRIGTVPRRPPGRAARVLARSWAWLLGAAVLGYLCLLPGTVLLDQLAGVDDPGLVMGLGAFSFAALALALTAARAHDRVRAA